MVTVVVLLVRPRLVMVSGRLLPVGTAPPPTRLSANTIREPFKSTDENGRTSSTTRSTPETFTDKTEGQDSVHSVRGRT